MFSIFINGFEATRKDTFEQALQEGRSVQDSNPLALVMVTTPSMLVLDIADAEQLHRESFNWQHAKDKVRIIGC